MTSQVSFNLLPLKRMPWEQHKILRNWKRLQGVYSNDVWLKFKADKHSRHCKNVTP